jgi:hypothetical protein
MTGPTRLSMPTSVLEGLADATRTSLPWREPAGPRTHEQVPGVLAEALATFGRPQVLLTLDLLHAGGRLRSWQRLAGDRVTTVSAAGADRVELAWLDAGSWRSHLAHTVSVPGSRAVEVRVVVAARVGGRNRVGWGGGALSPTVFADRVGRLVAGARS